MKKFLFSFLAALLVVSMFSFSALAAEGQGDLEAVNQGVSSEINLEDLETLEDSGEVEIEYLTYDQAITEIAANRGISKGTAKKMYPDKSTKTKTSTYKSGISTMGCSGCGTAPVRVTKRINVTSTYTPAVQVYVWVYSYGSFRQFKELWDVGLDLKDVDSTTVKSYNGTLKAEITNGNTIFFLVNGKFYNTGDTTITGEVSANGLLWSGSGSASYTSSYFAYYNNSGTIYLYN